MNNESTTHMKRLDAEEKQKIRDVAITLCYLRDSVEQELGLPDYCQKNPIFFAALANLMAANQRGEEIAA